MFRQMGGAGSGDCTTGSGAFAPVTDDEATHRPQSGNIFIWK